ncbi:hypothetical protein ACS0TY_010457 [Phlomoides rotata]
MYPRLFNLNLDKRGTVRDFGSWVEDRWVWSWRWRRSLLDRDIIYLNALNNLLDKFHLRNGVENTWKWRLSANGLYSTKDTYDLLLQNARTPYINGETTKGFKLIWKSTAPPKVIAHAWRLLWGRLPSKANLCRSGILSQSEDLRCVFCGLEEETGKHCFFECGVTHGIWMECFAWLQISIVIHPGTITNLLSFGNILPENLANVAQRVSGSV